MNINKININQSELTYYIASDIYDVTAHNNGATFESLSALLGSDNLSTLIPTVVRCGGMTIRFVQSSDNKYVQYRLMTNVWSTAVGDWQGIDDVPTAGSDNLVKSGGVYAKFENLENNTNQIVFTDDKEINGIISELYLDKTKVDLSQCQVLQIFKYEIGYERYGFRFYIDNPREEYISNVIYENTLYKYLDETMPFEIKKNGEVIGYVVINWDKVTSFVKKVNSVNENCFYLKNSPTINHNYRIINLNTNVYNIDRSLNYTNKNTYNKTIINGTLSELYNYSLLTVENLEIGEKYNIYAKVDVECNLVQSASSPIVLKHFLRGGEAIVEFTANNKIEKFGFFILDGTTLNYTLSVGVNAELQKQRIYYENEIAEIYNNISNPLKGCVFMSLGDSIFTEYYFMSKLREFIQPSKYYNLAVAGATWADKSDTTSYNGNPTFEGERNQNVLGNQLQKILNGIDDEYKTPPDYILIGAITNDNISQISDINDSTMINYIKQQFFDNNNNCIPITEATFDEQDTYKEYRKNVARAMRYVITKLQEIYPNAKIIISTPIQGSAKTKPYIDNINAIVGVEAKQRFIKHCSDFLSLRVIHTGEYCGILQDFEFEGAKWSYDKYANESQPQKGRDLIDGTHPDPNTGGLKMAKYIFKEMCKFA